MKKLVLMIITAVFLLVMIFLTIFAESIHLAALPKVTAARPKTFMFEMSVTGADGNPMTVYSERTALTKEQLEEGVYILYKADKNGTERTFVRSATLQTGAEQDGYIEIVSGLMSTDRMVISADSELYDGCEVVAE